MTGNADTNWRKGEVHAGDHIGLAKSWRVRIYHNILWSKYKGVVFTQLFRLNDEKTIRFSFVQIAETEGNRVALGGVDLSYHRYPHKLLFPGVYGDTPLFQRIHAVSDDLLRNHVDLVIIPGYERIEYWAMLILCILIRRRRAVFCDSTMFDRPRVAWRERAKRIFFRMCDGYFGYGVRSREYLLSYGVDPSKIYSRCQAAALEPDYSPVKVMSEYQDSPLDYSVEPTFLYVGRLSEEKGLFDLLEAFSGLRKVFGSARLQLVGAGPLREALIECARKLELSDSVEFVGSKATNEIVPMFRRCVALVLPSHSEPWGLVVNEALSHGCPVVVSDVCGCVPELVIDGCTGFSFRVTNIEDMSRAMIASIEMSSDRPLAARNCLSVIARFTPQHAAEQIREGCIGILERIR